jgi:hypothetical protein
MNGKEIVKLIEEWANKKRIHPDDFDMLFAHELLEMMEEDD